MATLTPPLGVPASVAPAGALVSGGNILSMLAAMGVFSRRGEQILAECGIRGVTVDGWYPLDAYVRSLDVIERKIGPNTLFRVGQEIPNHIPVPPGLDSFEKVVGCFGPAFEMNHRGVGAGGITFRMQDPRTGIITSGTPYPCPFDRGVILGFVKKFVGVRCTVEHAPGSLCKSTGGATCTHLVTMPSR